MLKSNEFTLKKLVWGHTMLYRFFACFLIVFFGGTLGGIAQTAPQPPTLPAPLGGILFSPSGNLGLDKWNIYTHFSQAIDKNLYKAPLVYHKLFGEKLDFQTPETNDLGSEFFEAVAEMLSFMPLIDLTIEFAAKSPQTSLDVAAFETASTVKLFGAEMKILSEYLQNRRNLIDDYTLARGKHQKILSLSQNLETQSHNFLRILNEEEFARRLSEIANMRTHGLRVMPALLESLNAAEKAHDAFIGAIEKRPNTTGQSLDLAAFNRSYNDLRTAINGLQPLIVSSETDKEGLGFEKVQHFYTLLGEFGALAAQIIEQHQKTPSETTNFGGTAPVLGQMLGALAASYNDLL
ncbi:MAG: DUF3829 domain-containing protein [Candidatus Adiutrix sp.]